MFSIKANKKTKSVLAKLPKQALLHKRSVERSNYTIGKLFVKENQKIISTGSRTGRLYRLRGGQVHQASGPGEAPKSRSGRLVRSVDYAVHGWAQMSLGQKAPYADYLDRGTKGRNGRNLILPRPSVIVAINNISGASIRIYYESFKKYAA